MVGATEEDVRESRGVGGRAKRGERELCELEMGEKVEKRRTTCGRIQCKWW